MLDSDRDVRRTAWVKSKNLSVGAMVLHDEKIWIVAQMDATMDDHVVHRAYRYEDAMEDCF